MTSIKPGQKRRKGFFVAHSGGGRFELGSTPVDLFMFDKELEELYPNRDVVEELKGGF